MYVLYDSISERFFVDYDPYGIGSFSDNVNLAKRYFSCEFYSKDYFKLQSQGFLVSALKI